VGTSVQDCIRADIVEHLAGETAMLLSLNIAGMSFSGGKSLLVQPDCVSPIQPTSEASLVTPHQSYWSVGIKPEHLCPSSEPTLILIPNDESLTSMMNPSEGISGMPFD
jgi:hypothetical protein